MKRQFRRILLLCLFFLGLSSIFILVYLIKEFSIAFQENDWVVGIVLSFWMLLTGMGAWLGRFYEKMHGRLGFLFLLQLLFAILPLITILKIDYWRSSVYPQGSGIEIIDLIYSAFILQLPIGLINGFLFIAYATLLARLPNTSGSTEAYSIKSIGGMIGGAMANFLVIWYVETFQGLLMIIALNLMVISVFISMFRKVLPKLQLIAILIFVNVAFYLIHFREVRLEWLYPDQKIVYDKSSSFGPVVITEKSGEFTCYENGVWVVSNGNEFAQEELVHFSLIQHPDPQKILLISGGITGIIAEILKYHPTQLDDLEQNPIMADLANNAINDDLKKVVRVYNEEGRRFLNQTENRYDAVLVNLNGPYTLQQNRFYTYEFFRDVKMKLNSGGILALQLSPPPNKLNRGYTDITSHIVASLHQIFRSVIVASGKTNVLIASDSSLNLNIVERLERKGVNTKFVNRFSAQDGQLVERNNQIIEHLNGAILINQDLRPVAVTSQLQLQSLFSIKSILMWAVIGGVLILALLSLNRLNAGLFAGGFTLGSVELFLLFTIQLLNGYLFQILGFLLMLFVAGLALGAWLGVKGKVKATMSNHIWVQLFMGVSVLFAFVGIYYLSYAGMSPHLNLIISGVLTLGTTVIGGLEFAIASQRSMQSGSTKYYNLYAVNLFGIAYGALLTTLYLFPTLGFFWSCFVLVILNGVMLLVSLSKRNISS